MPTTTPYNALISMVHQANAFGIEVGCNPAIIDRMLERRNGNLIKLVTDIVRSPDLTPAFKKVMATGRWDMTYEGIVLALEDGGLFDRHTIQCARWKLQQYGTG